MLRMPSTASPSETSQSLSPHKRRRFQKATAAVAALATAFVGYTPAALGDQAVDQAMQFLVDPVNWARAGVHQGSGPLRFALNRAIYRLDQLQRDREQRQGQLDDAQAGLDDFRARIAPQLAELDTEQASLTGQLDETTSLRSDIDDALYVTTSVDGDVDIQETDDATMLSAALGAGLITADEVAANADEEDLSWLRSDLIEQDSALRDQEGELRDGLASVDSERAGLMQPVSDAEVQIRVYTDLIADIDADIAETRQRIADLQARIAAYEPGTDDQQIKAGSPADAGSLRRLSAPQWWTGAAVSSFDVGTGFAAVDGTLWQAALGADRPLGDDFAVRFGIGARFGDFNGDLGNQADLEGVSLFGRIERSLSPSTWLDASALFGRDWYDFTFGFGPRDTFHVNRFELGVGLNGERYFSEVWRAEGRIGWNGRWADRPSSVDSTGFMLPSTDWAFGRASARVKLARQTDFGEVFGEATLRAVTNDDTIYNLDDNPIDAVLGGGFEVAISERTALQARGHAVIGRDDFEDYGAMVRLAVSY